MILNYSFERQRISNITPVGIEPVAMGITGGINILIIPDFLDKSILKLTAITLVVIDFLRNLWYNINIGKIIRDQPHLY